MADFDSEALVGDLMKATNFYTWCCKITSEEIRWPDFLTQLSDILYLHVSSMLITLSESQFSDLYNSDIKTLLAYSQLSLMKLLM